MSFGYWGRTGSLSVQEGEIPPGFEWEKKPCPNVGRSCHCTGVCVPRLVPVAVRDEYVGRHRAAPGGEKRDAHG